MKHPPAQPREIRSTSSFESVLIPNPPPERAGHARPPIEPHLPSRVPAPPAGFLPFPTTSLAPRQAFSSKKFWP